jgi:hypothetical protein
LLELLRDGSSTVAMIKVFSLKKPAITRVLHLAIST